MARAVLAVLALLVATAAQNTQQGVQSPVVGICAWWAAARTLSNPSA